MLPARQVGNKVESVPSGGLVDTVLNPGPLEDSLFSSKEGGVDFHERCNCWMCDPVIRPAFIGRKEGQDGGGVHVL